MSPPSVVGERVHPFPSLLLLLLALRQSLMKKTILLADPALLPLAVLPRLLLLLSIENRCLRTTPPSPHPGTGTPPGEKILILIGII